MLFCDVRSSLIGVLKTRVRNGELTERGLARVVGVSQPHIHNVLKGVRSLSPELSDQILQHLRMTLLDLIERDRLQEHLSIGASAGGYVYVRVLAGSIGPGLPWPNMIAETERLPFSPTQVQRIPNPIAARLGEDVRMADAFSAGDVALLDQSHSARTDINASSFYVVKSGYGGIIRRVRLSGNVIYLISEDTANRPVAWQRIAMEGRQITQIIRARAHLVTPVYEWSTS